MSDPNPPQYPGPEQSPADPPAYPPPPPAYPPPAPWGEQQPPPNGGQQYPPPQYGQPQYGQPQYPPPGYQPTGYQSPPSNPYVHWGSRLAAFLLDGAMLIPFYIPAVIGGALYNDRAATEGTQNIGLGIMIVSYVAGAAFAIWNQILRQGRTGSSLGKSVLGIGVVSEQTGTPIGGWKTLGRQFLHILDQLPCYLGYFWPLWDDKRQTFADKLMKTIVVRRAKALPPGYPSAPQQY